MVLSLLTGRRPDPRDITILTSSRGPAIDRADADMLAGLLEPISVKETTTSEGDLKSLTVPRTDFRKRLLADKNFRRTFRNLPMFAQDIRARDAKCSEKLLADSYVADTKSYKLAFNAPRSLIPNQFSISGIREWAEEWGQVRIPALLLVGIAGALFWSAWRLGSHAIKLFEEQNQLLVDAASTDAGLERAIRARAGKVRSESQQVVQETDRADTEAIARQEIAPSTHPVTQPR